MGGWNVIQSPTDAEMSAVQGGYLVADKLPIEDARLIAAAPDLLAACEAFIAALDGKHVDYDALAAGTRAAITAARTGAHHEA